MPIRIKKFEDINIKTIDYAAYFEKIKTEFTELVHRQQKDGIKDEAAIQNYLEENPVALTGLLPDIPQSHHIMGGVVISQPLLKSYDGDRQPDFLIITGNSLELYFNFIEIESRAKKLFQSAKVKVSGDFADALDQVHEWRTFTDQHYKTYCREMIDRIFRDQSNLTRDKTWHINYVLVYGDSREVTDKNDARYQRLLDGRLKDIKLVTYSRLLRQIELVYPLMTIKYKAAPNQYEAIGMVPYRNYGLDEWLNYHLIQNKQAIIAHDRFLSEAEKTELNATITRRDPMSQKEIWEDESLTTTEFSADSDPDIDL